MADQVGAAEGVPPEPVTDLAGLAERPQHDRSLSAAVELAGRARVGERRAHVEQHVGVEVDRRGRRHDVVGCHDDALGADERRPELGEERAGALQLRDRRLDRERRSGGGDDV